MKLLKRIIGFTKKISTGEHPIKIKYDTNEWERQFTKGNWDFLLNSPQNNIDVVVGMLRDISQAADRKLRILDVGCGNGSLARNLDPEKFAYTGIDISAEALKTAKELYPTGTFIQASMDDPSPVTEQYDIILFCEVLLYGDYEKILLNYADNLKSDGQLIVSLYQTWRTMIIWRTIYKQLNVLSKVHVNNVTKKVGWTVCLGTLKK